MPVLGARISPRRARSTMQARQGGVATVTPPRAGDARRAPRASSWAVPRPRAAGAAHGGVVPNLNLNPGRPPGQPYGPGASNRPLPRAPLGQAPKSPEVRWPHAPKSPGPNLALKFPPGRENRRIQFATWPGGQAPRGSAIHPETAQNRTRPGNFRRKWPSQARQCSGLRT